MSERIREIMLEFAKGCSVGKAGECDECLCAAISAINAQSGWQPIATAPEDGTRVIIYDGGEVFIASCDDYGIWCINEYDNLYCSPTHWMPLPAPPSA